jgi:hypothetical protein
MMSSLCIIILLVQTMSSTLGTYISPCCLGKSAFEFTAWGRFLRLRWWMREWHHSCLIVTTHLQIPPRNGCVL